MILNSSIGDKTIIYEKFENCHDCNILYPIGFQKIMTPSKWS